VIDAWMEGGYVAVYTCIAMMLCSLRVGVGLFLNCSFRWVGGEEGCNTLIYINSKNDNEIIINLYKENKIKYFN